MNSSDIYAGLLSTLTSTRAAMVSSAWQDILGRASTDDRVDASLQLLDVQHAIVTLSNAALKDIAQELNANATELRTAQQGLDAALKQLQNVTNILQKTGALLSAVAKIAPLLL